MRRLISTASLLLIAASTLACSEPADDGGEDTTGGTGQGGSSGASTGGSAGAATGGASGASTGGAGMTGGSSTGGSAGSATGGSGGSGVGTKTGICVQIANATASTTSFMGTEEFYIISEEAVDDGRTDNPAAGDMVCRIIFDVTRSGEGQTGCADLDGMACMWSQQVTYSNPRVDVDVDAACALSEIAWNATWVDGIDGSSESYGYIDMYEGHQSMAMKYLPTMMMWAPVGRGYWEPTTGEFTFNNTLGNCDY